MELSKRLFRLSWKIKGIRTIYGKIAGRTYSSDFEYVPGMTALEERDCYYQLVMELKGRGQIVDLGCWLGSTTLPLLKALHDSNLNKQNDIKVFAFDRFIWEDGMEETASWYPHAPILNAGDNFKNAFEKNMQPYLSMAEVVQADLSHYQWNNGPIEFLLIDAMKNLPLTIQIARTFLPKVVADGGIVIFQDFAHYYTSWLHIVTYELRHVLQPLFNVPYSGSMVFKTVGEINVEGLSFLNKIQFADAAYIEKVFDYSLSLVRGENKHKVIAAKAMWFVHAQNMHDAKRVFKNELESKYSNTEDVKYLRMCMTGDEHGN